MFLGSSCCNIAENSTFARPLDFACRLNPSFHAFAEACATETLDTYSWPAYYPLRDGNSWALVSARHNRKSSLNAALFDGSAIGIPAKQLHRNLPYAYPHRYVYGPNTWYAKP